MLAAEGYVAALVEARVTGRVVIALTFAAVFVARTATRDVTGTFLERSAKRLRAYPAFIQGDRTSLDALDKAADLDQAANRALATWFAEVAKPDDRVFLFGFDPSVYLEAGRAPASRYLYDVPLRATWSAEHRMRLLRDLRAQRPAAVAIERYDRMKMVTGSDADSFEAAHAFPEFLAFLDENYGKIDDLGRFERWVLRQTPKNEDIAPGSDTLPP